MKKPTHLRSVSLAPMSSYEQLISPPGATTPFTTPTSTKPKCVVIQYENFVERTTAIPPQYSSVSNLVREWEGNEKDRDILEDARRWVKDTFHAHDGITIRTLRLGRGWSQAQLAQKLGTSQSHVARIERGTENIVIDTCRRLCQALGVDMNTLDQALRQQENITREKSQS